MKRLIVGISGATGAIYGIRTLEVLKRDPKVEVHLVISEAAALTVKAETHFKLEEVARLADFAYEISDIGAVISSGSFQHDGMVIAPCSIKTMAMISNSINSNLMVRAADVTLKEKRRLVLLIRETPLHLGHLRLLANLAEMGAMIHLPVPAFYNRPKTLDDIINQTVGKTLDSFGINHNLFKRWEGLTRNKAR